MGKKMNLNNSTIYMLSSISLLLISIALLLSYSRGGVMLSKLNDKLIEYFGNLSFLVAISIMFFALFMTKLKIPFAKPNVSTGFLLFALCAVSLLKSGSVGAEINNYMKVMVGDPLTTIIFITGAFLGFIMTFNITAVHIYEIVKGFSSVITGALSGIFQGFSSLFKPKPEVAVNEPTRKPLDMKGMKGDEGTDFDKKHLTINNKRPLDIAPDALAVIQPGKNLKDELILNKPLEMGVWEFPPLALLSDRIDKKADRGDIKKIASTIEKTLQSFGIKAKVVEINVGPSVTQYALELSLGTKVSKITSLSNDLALATEAPTGQIRIEAPIPGRSLVGVEVPNRSLEIVSLKTMLSSSTMLKSKSKLTVPLGLDVAGNPLIADLAKMPHVLIAGTTGSGKSVLMNTFISSLLFRSSPAEVKMIMIDPKRVELTAYNDIPHLLSPVVVEPAEAVSALKWALKAMDKRYIKFSENGVRNIDSFNELSGFQALPYIVIFIDELADLMALAAVEVEDSIARLAQMARATGIHLVVSTQRPSVDVITGLIKANIPCRIAFSVSSMIDSKVIIDTPGAEKLLGRGDMLYVPPDQAKPTRIQGAFISEADVKRLVTYIKSKNIPIEYTKEVTEQQVNLKRGMGGGVIGGDGNIKGRDPFFEQAVRIICQYDKASSSLLQRRLSIGFARAARIIDQLEDAQVVGPGEGSKPRDVLIKNPDEFLANIQG